MVHVICNNAVPEAGAPMDCESVIEQRRAGGRRIEGRISRKEATGQQKRRGIKACHRWVGC